ncbi:hypothetical protein NDU88_004418 [Pleurodeles waltl]|uniref:Secreted protein n=1 Tax=Pleurodeles waltl TaxID=8319 RepID=A0AAV7UI58_PLEWA|nr:hypothetical protein NDU88_004418 [Pleurodeles waltl]
MHGSRLCLSLALPGSSRFPMAIRCLFILSVRLSLSCGGVLRPQSEGRATRDPHTAAARAQHLPPKSIARLQLSRGSGESHQGAPRCRSRRRRPQGRRNCELGVGRERSSN